MSDYHTDRAWSDRYLPELRRLIGPFLLVPSDLREDRECAADLVTLRAKDLTVACRVRRPGYASSFPDQFTVRLSRSNGAKTEYEKLVEGWGDWLFYGHATTRYPDIAPWWLIDLSAWRCHLIRSRKQILFGDTPNADGQTGFRWFRIKSFPSSPALLVGKSLATPVAGGGAWGIKDPPEPDHVDAFALIGGPDA